MIGRRYFELGRDRGLAAGLAAVLDGLDPAAAAPGGVAVLPSRPRARRRAHVLPHAVAAREGLTVVRFDQERRRVRPGPGLTGQRGAALAAVRLGVLARLLDQAVERLAGRRFGGVPLIDQQLVAGTVADAAILIELSAALDLAGAPAAALAAQHERLTDAGWAVTRLFGAQGYLADHPARALYASTLVADLWLGRADGREE